MRGGGQRSVEIDLSTFSDPSTKNAHDLAAYAINAWQSGWGYVWGTYGQIMTEELFASKLQQYPEGVGNYADFIQANWVGGRTADCVGLIKRLRLARCGDAGAALRYKRYARRRRKPDVL